MKLYYRIADDKECEQISKILGVRILPSLSEEYDIVFAVDRNTVDTMLLIRSGYSLLHRPNFSMPGFTRLNYSLNPYSKVAVDAAKNEAPSISFQEYLKMFDEKNGD